jgi:hypothetical protein
MLTTFKPEVFVQVKVFAVVAPSSQRLFVGALPAPPPLTRKPVFRMADEEDCVVELKYGIPPEVTVPETVTG